jgi:hypothetical protein
MFPQEIQYEQQHLQHLWNKHRWVSFCGSQENQISEQVQYVSTDGWWVVSYDNNRESYDVLFLGRSIEEAQNHIVR